jgi:hypothetical protein
MTAERLFGRGCEPADFVGVAGLAAADEGGF